jgi:hypothetical protein
MPPFQNDYFAAYSSLKLARDRSGVLVAEFHTDGGPFTFTAQDHTELVDAFYRIAQDRANKVVISQVQEGISFQALIFQPLEMLPIPAFGARFTMRAFRSSRT